MKEYIMSLICAAVASGIMGLVFKGSGPLEKYARLSLSVCLIACVIPSGVKDFERLKNEIPDTQDQNHEYLSEIANSYDKYVIEDTRKKMCSQLKMLIFEKSGIMPDSVSIEFNTDIKEDGIDVWVKSVHIVSSALKDNEEIKKYVYELTKVYPTIKEKSGVENTNG